MKTPPIYRRLYIFISDCLDSILFADFRDGKMHDDEHYYEYETYRDEDCHPRNLETCLDFHIECIVYEPCSDKSSRYPIHQGFRTVEKCLQIDHSRKFRLRHANAFQHGELFLSQFHVRSYRIEDISHTDGRDDSDESVEEYAHYQR